MAVPLLQFILVLENPTTVQSSYDVGKFPIGAGDDNIMNFKLRNSFLM